MSTSTHLPSIPLILSAHASATVNALAPCRWSDKSLLRRIVRSETGHTLSKKGLPTEGVPPGKGDPPNGPIWFGRTF